MIVNRRTALKSFLVISAGAAVLPSCLQDRSKSTVLLKNFQIDGEQEKLLAELAETIIPATTTPGAKDVSAHLFALKMLDDCYSKEDQQKFLKGLQQLDEAARTATGSTFVKSTPAQRESLISTLDNKITAGKTAGPSGSDLDFCYAVMKKQTILAYSSSAFFLTKVHVYELVPGRYHGCVPVNDIKTAS
ncbi:MAG TPA: gluconate 2-dehydrogenase subunit 3 family protein [Puia sp.]|jgi:hypothetical protein|nr:gluconate 2-dehydrogenase subunit 3 family protein [Puia sp.]